MDQLDGFGPSYLTSLYLNFLTIKIIIIPTIGLNTFTGKVLKSKFTPPNFLPAISFFCKMEIIANISDALPM